jgi:hypothetical protein
MPGATLLEFSIVETSLLAEGRSITTTIRGEMATCGGETRPESAVLAIPGRFIAGRSFTHGHEVSPAASDRVRRACFLAELLLIALTSIATMRHLPGV